jgi:mannan endo-1,4-beta-mannosidase
MHYPHNTAWYSVPLLLGVLLAVTAAAGSEPAVATGNFRVEGTTIYGPDGNVFIPVGGNMNGYKWGWSNRTLDPRHIESLVEEWGFNTIRLNCYIKGYHRSARYRRYGDFEGTYNVNNDLDAIIDAYTARGVVVIIGAHDWTGSGIDVIDEMLYNHNGDRIGSNEGETLENPFTEYGGREEYGSKYDILHDFFSYFARRYRDNPYVWFNPMNEPGTVVDQYRTADGEKLGRVPQYWVDMHGRFIQDMRALGFDNVIVVNGIASGQDHGRWWGDRAQLRPESSAIISRGNDVLHYGGTRQANVVFSVHVYHQMGYPTPEGEVDLLVQYVDAVHEQDLALMIGEAGWYTNRPTAEPAIAYRRIFDNDMIGGKGVGLLIWHLQPGDGMALVREGTFSRIDDAERPGNLTWMGEPLWQLTNQPFRSR